MNGISNMHGVVQQSAWGGNLEPYTGYMQYNIWAERVDPKMLDTKNIYI